MQQFYATIEKLQNLKGSGKKLVQNIILLQTRYAEYKYDMRFVGVYF